MSASMKTILAFGDSLTWGANPKGGRHRFEDRWTSVLESELPQVRVVAEGLSGRTTVFDDPSAATDRNGSRILPVLLGSHYPLDLVILMFGANDLKPKICGRAVETAAGMARLIDIIRNYPYGYGTPAPDVMLVSPPHFSASEQPGGGPAGDRSIEESQRLSGCYEAVAAANGCPFFDAAAVATACLKDGVHLDAKNTRAIGLGIAPVVSRWLARDAELQAASV